MKVLIVTYVFPPAMAVGAYRILKFCKYLIEQGIEPYILTPENPNTMSRDESTVSLIPDGVKVFRTSTLEPFRFRPEPKGKETDSKESDKKDIQSELPKSSLLSSIKKKIKQTMSVPDSSYFWVWYGLRPGIKLVKKENIDIVLSSSPPHSVHILGSRIAQRTGRSHVVDFRDLWTQNTSYAELNLPQYLKKRDRKFELKVLKKAAAITVNTATFKKQLLEKNRFLNDNNVQVITNGVDPDDFKNLLADNAPNDKFTLLYTGSLYGRHRDPEFFFIALRTWLDNNPDLQNQIRATFIGNWTPEYLALVEKYKLKNIIDKKEWMPQQDALKATFNADLLLLFQGFDPVLSSAIPRKLFEYMITNKPILAFAPPGEIPNLIEEYNCGVCFSDKATEPIVDFLGKKFDEWKNSIKSDQIEIPVLRSMPKLETGTQVKKLAELLNRLPLRE